MRDDGTAPHTAPPADLGTGNDKEEAEAEERRDKKKKKVCIQESEGHGARWRRTSERGSLAGSRRRQLSDHTSFPRPRGRGRRGGGGRPESGPDAKAEGSTERS